MPADGGRNDREGTLGEKKLRWVFTPEQTFEILEDIERCRTIKEKSARHRIGDQFAEPKPRSRFIDTV
jgi:hypothetical protein